MFEHVDAYAGDPILTLVETFHKDPRTTKVNLGIGLYYDEQGRIPLLGSVRQAEAAIAAGADYIGVGPLYATQTKDDVCAPVGLAYLDYVVKHSPLPFVAIGGIKEHNLAEVVAHGAKTLCLVTEIVGSDDIAATARRLQAACR